MKIGIYGGTFSPVHLGHVRAARAFLDDVLPDLLIIMPAGNPPHKNEWGSVNAQDRFEMCKAAFEDISDRISVSDFEIKKSAKCYTYETVMYLKEKYPDSDFTVLCGEDMILCLDEWFEAEQLMKQCSFKALARGNNNKKLEEKIALLNEKYGADISLIAAEPIEISSTEIRNMIANGEDVSSFVPEKVLGIINKKHLYRS